MLEEGSPLCSNIHPPTPTYQCIGAASAKSQKSETSALSFHSASETRSAPEAVLAASEPQFRLLVCAGMLAVLRAVYGSGEEAVVYGEKTLSLEALKAFVRDYVGAMLGEGAGATLPQLPAVKERFAA